MKFGYFDDDNKEYVITTPRTPLPWINYLGSGTFFTLLSNTAGGYAFYRDARLRRITRYRYNNNPLDMEGFRVYIREKDETGTPVVWNPGWMPVKTELDSYCCRHGLGYTVIEGMKNRLKAVQTFLVPGDDNCLLMKLELENEGTETKEFDVFSMVEFCLWDALDDSTNFQRNYSCAEAETEPNAIYHKTEYRERRNHYAVLWADRNYDGFDTARDAFCGMNSGAQDPEAVFGNGCTGSICHGWAPVGAMQFHMTLAPKEKQSLLLGLGYIENKPEEKWEAPNVINKKNAHEMMARYSAANAFEQAQTALKENWEQLLSRYHASVQTGDSLSTEKVNRMVNIWNQYQCMTTFNMSRSASYFESGMGRGMGFRDSCQDLLGFVHMIPERARERILDIAATQFPDGSAYHQYQPLTKKGNMAVGSGFNDDPLWLVASAEAYIAETGDYTILDEMVDFDNNPELAQPLMEHLRRSIQYTQTHMGPHKLPLIGRADWNDCLNLNCFSEAPGESFQTSGPSDGPVAESVFIAGMFVKYGSSYAKICRGLADRRKAAGKKQEDRESGTPAEELQQQAKELLAEAKKVEKAVTAMKETVLSDGWDGEWFLRAYDANGEKVGSHTCDEGRIFIEPQGMCVLAGIGRETGEAEKALKSVEEHLDTKFGLMLLHPSYTGYRLNLGEITTYPPGYKENGGIFCHNNPWVVCAETTLGHGNRAFEIYKKTCPAYIEDYSDIHRTEPYVYSQMIAGSEAPAFGEAKNSWLTGTAAWSFVCISQYILGIRPETEGLKIAPVIPKEWNGMMISRTFRGAVYHITINNEAHVECGIRSAVLDGKELPVSEDGTVILPPVKGGEAQVQIFMG